MAAEEPIFEVAVVEQAGHRATVSVKGEVDVATAPQLWEAIEGLHDTRQLVVDLAELTFMDSTGLRVLVRAHELMTGRGGDLVVRSPDAATRKLLEITSVDKVITVE